MRKYILAIAAVLITIGVTAQNAVTVVDADRAPVAGASVISANGLILGFTDAAGAIKASERDYPLSVRCLGYEAATVGAPCDTVYMQDATFSLPEMVVSTAGRPITRVVTYARSYCSSASGGDTLQIFGEFMLEYFFADGKVKGYKKWDRHSRTLASRFGRHSSNKEGADETTNVLIDIMTPTSLQNKTVKETETIKNGAVTDTVQGKFWPEHIYRKNNQFYSVSTDVLANQKDHMQSFAIFKLLGFNIECSMLEKVNIYKINEEGIYDMRDFLCGTSNMHMLANGKFMKKFFKTKSDVDLYIYEEQYPVSIERLTVEDYQEMRADRKTRKAEFQKPDYVLPLAPPIQKLADRMDLEVSRLEAAERDDADEADDE